MFGISNNGSTYFKSLGLDVNGIKIFCIYIETMFHYNDTENDWISGNKVINFQDYNAHTIGIILLWLSAFLTLYTGYDYIKKGIDHAID